MENAHALPVQEPSIGCTPQDQFLQLSAIVGIIPSKFSKWSNCRGQQQFTRSSDPLDGFDECQDALKTGGMK